nr:putative integron gene cassette protein [uncultured bacterium]
MERLVRPRRYSLTYGATSPAPVLPRSISPDAGLMPTRRLGLRLRGTPPRNSAALGGCQSAARLSGRSRGVEQRRRYGPNSREPQA